MKASASASQLNSQIAWGKLTDPRKIERLGERCVEVLKGIRLAGSDAYISSSEVHEILFIQAGRKFASSPSNITGALQRFEGHLEKSVVDGILKFRFPLIPKLHCAQPPTAVDPTLVGICERFHRAVAHLTHRRKGKQTINFADEYDVQDVFGTVVKCFYNDVRDEEWTPSYAASAARLDFLISDIQTAAELKRARPAQAIADELILDIARYSKIPDVKSLFCFVYDPDGLLRRNAAEIETDLSGHREQNGHELNVFVLIRPK